MTRLFTGACIAHFFGADCGWSCHYRCAWLWQAPVHGRPSHIGWYVRR